jgi:hypothetical protein
VLFFLALSLGGDLSGKRVVGLCAMAIDSADSALYEILRHLALIFIALQSQERLDVIEQERKRE